MSGSSCPRLCPLKGAKRKVSNRFALRRYRLQVLLNAGLMLNVAAASNRLGGIRRKIGRAADTALVCNWHIGPHQCQSGGNRNSCQRATSRQRVISHRSIAILYRLCRQQLGGCQSEWYGVPDDNCHCRLRSACDRTMVFWLGEQKNGRFHNVLYVSAFDIDNDFLRQAGWYCRRWGVTICHLYSRTMSLLPRASTP